MRMHDNQLDISPEVARTLIDRQFPQWRSLPVRPVAATGTVNAIFRVGDRYAARFPLAARDAVAVRRSLEAEADAAAELAGRTRFQTPEPSSSPASGRSPPSAGRSPAAAAAATCTITTSGWKRASCAARGCSTRIGCAGCGPCCGTCRAEPPRT
jgi:hypothetical protein